MRSIVAAAELRGADCNVIAAALDRILCCGCVKLAIRRDRAPLAISIVALTIGDALPIPPQLAILYARGDCPPLACRWRMRSRWRRGGGRRRRRRRRRWRWERRWRRRCLRRSRQRSTDRKTSRRHRPICSPTQRRPSQHVDSIRPVVRPSVLSGSDGNVVTAALDSVLRRTHIKLPIRRDQAALVVAVVTLAVSDALAAKRQLAPLCSRDDGPPFA